MRKYLIFMLLLFLLLPGNAMAKSDSDNGRYQLVPGKIGDVSTMFRVDSSTGQTWMVLYDTTHETYFWGEVKSLQKAMKENRRR